MYGQGNEPELLDPGIDVLLIFPPVTEARLFPYLSLPMITSYLKRAGVRTAQVDLNLALSMRLFSSECLAEYRELADQGRLNPRLSSEALPGEVRRLWLPYRRELSTFLLEHRDSLARCAFDTKHHPQFGTDAALRLVRLGMELLLEGSSLVAHARSIPALEFMAGQAADADGSIAARQLRALVHELLERMTPRLLAVSIAFYSQIAPSLMIARWAKELFPELCVVFGGQQIMLRHEEFAASSGFRRWVNGLGTADGEETLLALHHTLLGQEKSEAIPNFIWLNRSKSPDEIRVVTGNLNERPTPDFSGLAIRSYLSDEVQLPLITCVGCYWGRCCFCSYGNRSRRERNYRQLSPDVLAGHCRSLVDRYGVSRINFVDENTNLNLILRAMRVLNNQGYRIRFSTRNRLEASLSDESFCRELRQRGCVLMSAGYETNSQRLLDLIDKGVSARHYQQIVDNLHRVGIPL